jgi:hypothetical protein
MKIVEDQLTIYNNYAHRIQTWNIINLAYVEVLDDAYDITITSVEGKPLNYKIINSLSAVEKDDTIYIGYMLEMDNTNATILTCGGKIEIANYDTIREPIEKFAIIINEDPAVCGFEEIIISYFTKTIKWSPIYTAILENEKVKSFLCAIVTSKYPIEVNNLRIMSSANMDLLYEVKSCFSTIITENSSYVIEKTPFAPTAPIIFVELNKETKKPQIGYRMSVNQYLPAGKLLFYKNSIKTFLSEIQIEKQEPGNVIEYILGDTTLIDVKYNLTQGGNINTYDVEIINRQNNQYNIIMYSIMEKGLFRIRCPIPYEQRNNITEYPVQIPANSKFNVSIGIESL